MLRFLLIYFCVWSVLGANIKSSTGQISFDVDSDGQADAVLNTRGFGVNGVPSDNLTVMGNAVIGQINEPGSLLVNGTLHHSIQSLSSNATLGDNTYVLVDTSDNNLRLSLPYAGNVSGRLYNIKKTTAFNTMYLDAIGSTIDYHSPIEVSEPYASLQVLSDGSKWHVVQSSFDVATVASENLIAYWNFDQVNSSNVSHESSVTDYAVSLNNLASDNLSVPAVIGNGVAFDGVNDYGAVANDAAFHGMSEMTVSMWVYIRGKQDYSGLFCKTDQNASNTNRTFRVQFDNSADQKFRLNLYTSGGTDSTISDAAAPLHQWVHVLVGYDGAQTYMYIDNVLQADQDASSGEVLSYANAENSLSFGHQQYDNNNNNATNCILDEVRFYNRFLNAEERNALFQQGQ